MLKGVLYLFAWLLFISRLIPKYYYFKETNQVHIFGKTMEGELGVAVLLGILVLAIILLALSIMNFQEYFRQKKSTETHD